MLTIIIGVGFYMLSRYNYLLFHLTVENFTIITGVLIFTISHIARKYGQGSFLELLGPGILVSSLITFLHLATYKGMDIISGFDANIPTQLWIISSYILSVSVLVALWRMSKKTNLILLYCIFVSAGAAGTVLSFMRIFPNCFVEGDGLTLFKQISEYVIIAVYASAFIPLVKNKSQCNAIDFKKTILWLSLLIVSEFMFTLYRDVFGIQNFLGHYIRLIAFYLIFSAVVVESVQKPLTAIFGKLNNMLITDGLTSLFNHRFFIESLEKYQDLSVKEGKPLYLIVFDIDRFKEINDTYGHVTGDKVLVETAKLLKSSVRSSDLAFRQGGDEFAVILYDAKIDIVKKIIERIKTAFAQALVDTKIQITLSGGAARYSGENIHAFITEADRLLYQAKENGRNMVHTNF